MKNSLTQKTQLLPFKGIFSLSDIGAVSAEFLAQLSPAEKEELAECSNHRRQREFVSSRIDLKKMAEEIGAEQGFEILKDERGQPYGKTPTQSFYVSIAHTDECVFCGLTEADPIGVDLEPIDRKVPARLEQRITHPQEKKLIDNVSALRLWTIKEAYIKLRGQGLRLNMNEVQIQQESDQFFTSLNNDKRAKICSFRLKNKWLAIAYYQK
ncbi:MAG: 4'-phosphopantetheinyl transferase family protein [Bacteroidota bacterium]